VSSSRRYRSKDSANRVIGFSISYQRENFLARGLGLEHLRELLLRLARPILRQGASLAYPGHWKETEENFTYELLRLISAEQEDNSLGGFDTNLVIGRLYNHSAWPDYLEITARIEAQWIDCCRIVRITQKDAGIADEDVLPDNEGESEKGMFNAAVTLSTLRRLVMEGTAIHISDTITETVPPVAARIALGGNIEGFSGFIPGIFEEALVTLEYGRPLFILGGFGGSAEVLARALLDVGTSHPPEFTTEWHQARNAKLGRLLQACQKYTLPSGVRTTSVALDNLFEYVLKAKSNLSKILNTGLDEQETRELLTTRDISKAVQLVRKGLDSQFGLKPLPA
jgi:hypothetical protein